MQDWSGLLREVKQRSSLPHVPTENKKLVVSRSIKKLYLGEPFATIYFTQREAQVALCLLQGKSFIEVGTCLQIAERTVESYVASMRKKLQCANKWALVQCLWTCSRIQKLFDGIG